VGKQAAANLFFCKNREFFASSDPNFSKKDKRYFISLAAKVTREEKSGAPESACLFVHAQPIGSRVEREWRSPLFAPAFRGIQVITVNNKKEEAV
jgi:hypothetical protein